MNKPKFTYFDVGGVLVLDFSNSNKWEVMKRVMGVKVEQDQEFDKYFDAIEIDVAEGRHEIDYYLPEMVRKFELTPPPNFSMLDYIVERIEPNPSITPVIEKARTLGPIGLVTDMYPKMLDMLRAEGTLPNYQFDVIIDSSVVGAKKPGVKIYEIAEERSGVQPESILFIDNLESNLVIPNERGWQTFHYDPSVLDESSRLLLEKLSS